MRFAYTILLLALVFGCSLNSDQEKSLHDAQRSYVDARNEADVLKYVGYSHPNVIAHYKHLSDSSFQNKFDLSQEPYTIQDGTIREIKSKGKSIHVKYSFRTVEKGSFGVFGDDINIYAISEDDGQTWFFLNDSDYRNVEIIPKNHQLIKSDE